MGMDEAARSINCDLEWHDGDGWMDGCECGASVWLWSDWMSC